jgi:predicted metal-binding protein
MNQPPRGDARTEDVMSNALPRPVATKAYAVRQTALHQILVCKACKHTGEACEPGHKLLKQLRAAIEAAGLDGDFEVSGTACLAGCVPAHGRGCVVAWRASAKATWMFGDIDPAQPIDDLIAFSRLYAALDDGWCSGRDCPPRLCDNTLARIPAAIIATKAGPVQ